MYICKCLFYGEEQRAPACPGSVEDEGMWQKSDGVTEIFRGHLLELGAEVYNLTSLIFCQCCERIN